MPTKATIMAEAMATLCSRAPDERSMRDPGSSIQYPKRRLWLICLATALPLIVFDDMEALAS